MRYANSVFFTYRFTSISARGSLARPSVYSAKRKSSKSHFRFTSITGEFPIMPGNPLHTSASPISPLSYGIAFLFSARGSQGLLSIAKIGTWAYPASPLSLQIHFSCRDGAPSPYCGPLSALSCNVFRTFSRTPRTDALPVGPLFVSLSRLRR